MPSNKLFTNFSVFVISDEVIYVAASEDKDKPMSRLGQLNDATYRCCEGTRRSGRGSRAVLSPLDVSISYTLELQDVRTRSRIALVSCEQWRPRPV